MQDHSGSEVVRGAQEAVERGRLVIAQMLRPRSLEELVDAVISTDRVSIVGTDSKRAWLTPQAPVACLSTAGLSGIIDFSPDDQVVSVRAGTLIEELQAELQASKQCLPLGILPAGTPTGTVGGALALNLPHALEAECGTWRDWILGATFVLADGTVAKSGSHAVKNVAGYDLHKLAVGSRGTLFVVAEVILRTFPLKSLPSAIVEGENIIDLAKPVTVQRTLRTDFEQTVAGLRCQRWPNSCTLITNSVEVRRYAEDWVLRANYGEGNLELREDQRALTQRTKSIFDPADRLPALT